MTREGMTVTWRLQATAAEFSLRWPSHGWAAIGLNTQSGLPGTQLLMVSIVNGRPVISDRHAVAAGDHRPVQALGGAVHLAVRGGQCDASGCEAVFVVDRAPRDRLHHALEPGRPYYLLMAYSAQPDFDHHSLFRTDVEITFDAPS